jgi:hypothetical protein
LYYSPARPAKISPYKELSAALAIRGQTAANYQTPFARIGTFSLAVRLRPTSLYLA